MTGMRKGHVLLDDFGFSSVPHFNSLNAKRELSASPFMQCYALYCVHQNHFEYAYKCNTDMHVTP